MVRRRRTSESGHVLVFALVVVVLLSTALSVVALLLAEEQKALEREVEALELTSLGDAALAWCLAELARNPGFSRLSRRELGRGEIESQVTVLSPSEAQIRSTATFRGRSRVSVARVSLGGGGPRVMGWSVERPPPRKSPSGDRIHP